jgi:capsular polysaccharide biosynthesis protein
MSEPSNPNLSEPPRVGGEPSPRIALGGADLHLSEPVAGVPAGVADAQGPRVEYGAGNGDRAHLTDYVRVLYKRRWTAITAFVLVFGTVTIYTFTATPIYEARLQLLIENQEQKVVQFQQVLDESRTLDYYQTQYRVLQSRALARRTLDAEQLWTHPLFAGGSEQTGFRLNPLTWPGALVRAISGSPGQHAEAPDSSETAAQSGAIDRFLASLAIAPVRNSRLVDIRYRSPDPQLSARIANALARQYIEQNLEFKFLATKEATEFAERAGIAEISRANRRRRPRGSPEHRRPAACRLECGRYARPHGPYREGGGV